jgi:hypothetical protein
VGFEELSGSADWGNRIEPEQAADVAETESPAEVVESEMDEVERRLGMAALYNEILKSSIFNDSDGPLVRIVEEEFKSFALSRRRALLGLDTPAADGFNRDEVAAVKKILLVLTDERLDILDALAARALSVTAARTTTLRPPARSTPMPPAAPPTVRKREVPQVVKSPVKPPTKPVEVASRPPQQPAPPAAKPEPIKRVATRPTSVADIPPEEAPYREGGVTYRAKYAEVAADEYGPEFTASMEALQPGQACRLKNGVRVFNLDGQLMKLVPKQISGQAKVKGMGIPFPAGNQQMAAISANATGQAQAISERTVEGNLAAKLM